MAPADPPFIVAVLGFQPLPVDSEEGVRFMAGRPDAAGALLGAFAGPNRPLPVAFNVGIPPESF